MLLHDVATCWNLTYDILVMALEYKKVIEQMISDDEEMGD